MSPGPDGGMLPQMAELFSHTDYRAFLKEYLDERREKDSFFSLRYFASKVGTDAGTIVKILQGQLQLSPRLVPAVASVCKFDERQSEYFHAMVEFSKAKTPPDIRRTFERLCGLKGVRSRTLEEHQYAFYQRWYHSAVRAAIGIRPFSGDFKELASSLVPAITVAQARESVDLLERLGLVRRGGDGVWNITDRIITTGEKWKSVAVREFQKQTMELALTSLERDPVELREHSTVTLTLRRGDLDLLKRRTAEFRQDLLKLAEQSEGDDSVFQVNIQIFPLAVLSPEAP